jgi:hypothetical protein
MSRTRQEVLNDLAQIIAEVVDMEFDMLAIGVVLVNKEQRVFTKFAYDENGRFLLLGGVALLQDNIIMDIQTECTGNVARS